MSTVLLAGFLEFSFAAFFILEFASGPKNGVIFGYSLSRLTLFLFAFAPAIWLLILLRRTTYRVWVMQKLDTMVPKMIRFWVLIIIVLFLIGLVILTIPFEMFGKYGGYFELLRPIFCVLCVYPVQFFLGWLTKHDLWSPELSNLRPMLISLGTLFALSSFIFFS